MNIKIRVCQIIGPAAAGSAGPVPTALPVLLLFLSQFSRCRRQRSLGLKKSCVGRKMQQFPSEEIMGFLLNAILLYRELITSDDF